jgi:hypothetical protein
MPRDSKTAQNLVDAGRCSAGRAPVGSPPASGLSSLCGPGDRAEGLRRTRGDAAGVKLGPAPADRWPVNVGSAWALPYPPGVQPGGGQARRPLTAPGRGRAPVVVRRRESRRHGEGGSRLAARPDRGKAGGEYRRAVAGASTGTGTGTRRWSKPLRRLQPGARVFVHHPHDAAAHRPALWTGWESAGWPSAPLQNGRYGHRRGRVSPSRTTWSRR